VPVITNHASMNVNKTDNRVENIIKRIKMFDRLEDKCEIIAATFLMSGMTKLINKLKVQEKISESTNLKDLGQQQLISLAEEVLFDALIMADEKIIDEDMSLADFISLTIKFLATPLKRPSINNYPDERAKSLADRIEKWMKFVKADRSFILN